MTRKISAGTVIAALLTLASSAGAASFPRYNEEFPSVEAILTNRDSSIAAPKATLVNHGVHVIDGANMAQFFEIFKSLTPEQRLKFLQDGKWPYAAWQQFDGGWCEQLIVAVPADKIEEALQSMPRMAFSNIVLRDVDDILNTINSANQISSNEDRTPRKPDHAIAQRGFKARAAFMSYWFQSNYPAKDLMLMNAAIYVSLKGAFNSCGVWCMDLTPYLKAGWSDAVVKKADQMTVSELILNLPLLDVSSKKTDVIKKWMESQNSKAAIEKFTPTELVALLQIVPGSFKNDIVNIWIAAANNRAVMTPDETKAVIVAVPEASRRTVVDAWMKAAPQPQ